ncbi:MAG: P-loop NTPase family protein [Thermomicrobiales bacterium]
MTLWQLYPDIRIPYALRRVPPEEMVRLIPNVTDFGAGEIALARVEKVGKNTTIELATGRRSALHEGDTLAIAFGNRYATRQFEGLAHASDDRCDLLSMGGLCGMVVSKHDAVSDPSRLRLLGAIGNADGQRLRLGDYRLLAHPPLLFPATKRPRVVVVCGTSMEAGKTHTMMSLIVGLRRQGARVAAIKLTGTATGRDTWTMADAGACVALDFVDGGFPSTYLCDPDDLIAMHHRLIDHAATQGADWVVVEIADGLLQRETAALLQSPDFTATVDTWILAAGEPMAAVGGIAVLRGWGIEPLGITGLVTMSPLGVREVEASIGSRCLTARELQCGDLDLQPMEAACRPASIRSAVSRERVTA